MDSPKKLENTALVGLLAQIGFALGCWALYMFGAEAEKIAGSTAVLAEFFHLAVGIAVWAVVYFHGRSRRLAAREKEDRDRLRTTRLSEEIFEEQQLDSTSAQSILRVFEKYVVTIASVLLALAMLYLAYRMGRMALSPGQGRAALSPMAPGSAPAIGVGMVFMAFAGLLIGKYAAGLAQDPQFRLLRAAAGYVMGNVVACLLIMVAMGLYYFDVKWPHSAVAAVIPAIMALVGLEILLNLMLDIYRPHVEGRERRPPYDSRLLGLFAEPGGVLKTVAATLDYQFGFKVSETWFYRFIERAILPLLLVQIVSLWLLTCVTVVDQGEIAFIEQFGRPIPANPGSTLPRVFDAGYHLKLPWPFAVARVLPAYRTHMVKMGDVYHREELSELLQIERTARDEDFILWNERRFDKELGREANFIVASRLALRERQGEEPKDEAPGQGAASEADRKHKAPPPVSLANLKAYVLYHIKRGEDGKVDPKAAFDYYYRETDIERHVNLIAYRALCRVAAGSDIADLMSGGRARAAKELARLVQDAFTAEGMGLEVTDAGFTRVHPPYDAARAFESALVQTQLAHKLISEAETTSNRTLEEARTREAQLIADADAYYDLAVKTAMAERKLFDARRRICREGGDTAEQRDAVRRVYSFRHFCDTMEEALRGHRIYIVPPTQIEVDVIDLERKFRTDVGGGSLD